MRVRRLEERLIVPGLTVQHLDGILGRSCPGRRRTGRGSWHAHGSTRRSASACSDDANAALDELGLSMSTGPVPLRLTVVANSPTTHNVLVCTLCSCYPIGLLGPSPSWYKSEAYRARVVREPRAVLAEFGLTLPADTEIVVHDTSAESRHLVLPMRPAGSAGLDESDLAALVTREGLIGTASV